MPLVAGGALGFFQRIVVAAAFVMAFLISAILFPVAILFLAIPALIVLTNPFGLRRVVERSRLWSRLPLVAGRSPRRSGFMLLGWMLVASVVGIGMYGANASTHVAHANATATQIAHTTEVAQATAVAVEARVVARQTEVAVAQAQAQQTTVAEANATATAAPEVTATAVASAIAQATAAPRETATARRIQIAAATAKARSAKARRIAATKSSPPVASSDWPPQTLEQTRELAASSQVQAQVVKKEQGYDCLCKLWVVLPTGLTEEQEASALLKVFYSNDLYNVGLSSQAGVNIYGYAGQYTQQGYTAGSVYMNMADTPHQLVIDTGPSSGPGGQEYTIGIP